MNHQQNYNLFRRVHIINTLLYNPQKKILMFLLNYESKWGSLGEREIPVLWENEVRYQICFHNTV